MGEKDRILRRVEVESITGIKTTTLYKLMREDKFPKNFPLAGKPYLKGWLESEVYEWIRQQQTSQRFPNNKLIYLIKHPTSERND